MVQMMAEIPIVQRFYTEDSTDKWSIRTETLPDFPGFSYVSVFERLSGVMLFNGCVRDGQVCSTVLLAVLRHQDMMTVKIDAAKVNDDAKKAREEASLTDAPLPS